MPEKNWKENIDSSLLVEKENKRKEYTDSLKRVYMEYSNLWNFDDIDSADLPSGKNWFFGLMPYGRVGSTSFFEIMQKQKDMICFAESHFPYYFSHILNIEKYQYFSKDNEKFITYNSPMYKKSILDVRNICDYIKNIKYKVSFIGDKGPTYFYNPDFIDKLFPDNTKILFVRCPLDALSSLINQNFSHWLMRYDTNEKLYDYLISLIDGYLSQKDSFDGRVIPINFEDMKDFDKFKYTYTKILESIEYPLENFNFEEEHKKCKHININRWIDDETIKGMLEYIKNLDKDKYDLYINDESHKPEILKNFYQQ